MSLTKDKLIYDTAAAADTDNVGAYLKSSDGTHLTHTTVGGKEALDVYLAGLDGTELGVYDEDSAHVSGDKGQFVLAVRNDAEAALAADGDYSPLQVDANGRLKIAGTISVEPSDAEFLEDSAHSSGDALIHTGSVRQDTLGISTSTDGDYGSLKADSHGRLYVQVAPNKGIAQSAVSVSTVAIALPASPLAGRSKIVIQNKGDKPIFLGSSGVTTSTGFEVSKGGTFTFESGEKVEWYAIAASGTNNVRVVEVA